MCTSLPLLAADLFGGLFPARFVGYWFIALTDIPLIVSSREKSPATTERGTSSPVISPVIVEKIHPIQAVTLV